MGLHVIKIEWKDSYTTYTARWGGQESKTLVAHSSGLSFPAISANHTLCRYPGR